MDHRQAKRMTPGAGLLAAALVLSGCGAADVAAPEQATDPAIAQALNDQIMVDPDLANQNEANAVLTVGIDHSLPVHNPNSESIRQARSEAVELVGGEERMKVPEVLDEGSSSGLVETGFRTLTERAAEMPEASACAEGLEYSAIWAASMPKAFPVYPRGATQSAAGNVRGDCVLRAISFHSAASLDDLSAFYAAMARLNGFTTNYSAAGQALVLSGERGSGTYRIVLQPLPSGLFQVDLLTNAI